MSNLFNPCIIIPCYNHVELLLNKLPEIEKHKIPIIIVDDASEHLGSIESTLKGYPTIFLIRHTENQGKGGAIISGINHALEKGYTHAVQVDADGQHNYEDLPKFIESAKNNPNKLILGTPIFDQSAPKVRIYGRKISTALVALETLSISAHDVLFGFRVYPLTTTLTVINKFRLNTRMGFDVQIIVYHLWNGVRIKNIKSKVKYHDEINSNFRYLQDNLSFIGMHVKLLILALYFTPVRVIRKAYAH